IQLYGYNAELYHNMSEAQHKPQGIVYNYVEFFCWKISNEVGGPPCKSHWKNLEMLKIESCGTFATSIDGDRHQILLQPMISRLYALRRLKQGSEEQPKAPLGNNVRPLQFIHSRTVRTNIDFKQTLTQMFSSE
ncbi:uncharacterized protein LOC103505108, partial [Diaphorina citri]|uniref:Uncharacterized protein LOC103505108 n=1 Tax=Diaphorina citri TaxID=121845 RepID=A0A3Q0IPP1_DIACI